MNTFYWKNKNVFVTGVTGLLGSNLIKELLLQDANVFALVRDMVPDSQFFSEGFDKKINVIVGDLLDISLLQRVLNEFDIQTVFHLGAQSIVEVANRFPITTFKSNIEGTWNLLEACRLSPWVKKVVVASSGNAYGAHQKLPYFEDAPLQGRYPYDVSKSCADLLAQSYFHTYKLPVCVTRCGNFFGAGDLNFSRIIPGTIRSVLNNQPPVIYSNGLSVRDYMYVKDVVNAYLCLAESMDDEQVIGQCFNFSTDQPFTVIQIVDLILELMQAKHLRPVIQNRLLNEIPEQHLCSEKARTVLGWSARYGVRVGLVETIDWYTKFWGQKLMTSYVTRENFLKDYDFETE